MEEQAVKIQRSSNLVKGFMALVIIFQVVQFYQTRMLDFGEIAGVFGILFFLRGLLSSPLLLVAPLKHWFKSNLVFSTASYKYFICAFVLVVVSLL
tara:strand:- start:350 stop:637 length:288 start_codon:yes stop_codon:yes gene_type:complete